MSSKIDGCSDVKLVWQLPPIFLEATPLHVANIPFPTDANLATIYYTCQAKIYQLRQS